MFERSEFGRTLKNQDWRGEFACEPLQWDCLSLPTFFGNAKKVGRSAASEIFQKLSLQRKVFSSSTII